MIDEFIISNLRVKQFIYLIAYPQPDPPTIATFLPLGMVNDTFLKIGFPSTYWKFTFLN